MSFCDLLIEKSHFYTKTVENAMAFGKNIDLDCFEHLFFESQEYTVEKSGVLCFEDSFYPYEFYQQIKKLGTPFEKSSLYLYILLSEKAFSLFKKRGLSNEIFFETLKTVADEAKEYHTAKGDDGLFNYHLLANNIIGSILRLGVFEYQYGIYNNSRAIFMHVPNGADLTKEKRLHSYLLAKKYYGDLSIVGDSWLLYPENKKILPSDSKIVDFMNDFDLISVYETMDYSELFHIFGRLSDYSYENLPKKTCLQRGYAERILEKLPIGSGVGVLKF